MKVKATIFLLWLGSPFLAFANTGNHCTSVEDNDKRLECYDQAFNRTTNAKPEVKKETKWRREVIKDKMSSEEIELATIFSDNTVNFDFPYEGEQKASLTLKNSRRSDYLIFDIRKGQIVCDTSCNLLIKVDDNSPFTIYGNRGQDGSPTYTFAELSAKQLNEIKKATKILIQPTIYQNGSPVFEFSSQNNPYVGTFKYSIEYLEKSLKENTPPELVEVNRYSTSKRSFKDCLDSIYGLFNSKSKKNKMDVTNWGELESRRVEIVEENNKNKFVLATYREHRASKTICDKQNNFFGEVNYEYKH